MSDIYALLEPYLDRERAKSPHTLPPISAQDPQTIAYLKSLSTFSLADLSVAEPEALVQNAGSHSRNLQALSKRSYKAVISSSSHLDHLKNVLPALKQETKELRSAVPDLDATASKFAAKYDWRTENAVLQRRKRAMLLARNVDRVSDILDLPSLLSTTVSASQTAESSTASVSATSHAAALDLHAHVKRLHALYPHSTLVADITEQAEVEMANLATALIATLQSHSLKLATAMRTIGFLRRVAPDMAGDTYKSSKPIAKSMRALGNSANPPNDDDALGALFLVCRLHTLYSTLATLEPLQELADQETTRRIRDAKNAETHTAGNAVGSQSERYLKRYIEIFREQSFNIISMYKSIFPNGLPQSEPPKRRDGETLDPLLPLPSSLATFSSHLVDILFGTLQTYLANVSDTPSRESLLTQVLYCAGSVGRSGADFGMMIALMEHERDDAVGDEEPEWAQVMKKHRVQTGRLEVLARGVGSGSRSTSMELRSPPATAAPSA